MWTRPQSSDTLCFSLNWEIFSRNQKVTAVDKLTSIVCDAAQQSLCPHVGSLFYLETKNRLNQVKQSTDAADTFKLCRAHSNHQPSTSTRCGRPCYRKAYTHTSYERPHTSSHVSALFTSKQHYRKSREIGGQVYSVLRIRFKWICSLLWWGNNSKNHKYDDNVSSASSQVQRDTQSNTYIDSNRCFIFPWCWAGRANSWTATALPFFLTNPTPHPQASSCSFTYSTAFFMWGPLDTSKGPVWELQWGDKQPQPSGAGSDLQCKANTCWRVGVRGWWDSCPYKYRLLWAIRLRQLHRCVVFVKPLHHLTSSSS